MYVYAHMCSAQKGQKRVPDPLKRQDGTYKPPCESWESNPGRPEDQPGLLTAESSLEHQGWDLLEISKQNKFLYM